jgi:5-carboxymethyl-2-hydroxymuconate isomerase
MPQLILEYSDNIIEKDHLRELLGQCNQLIVEMLPAELKACKSRAVMHSNYCIGDGNYKNAFAHINLRILPGRSEEAVEKTGEELLKLLRKYFSKSFESFNLQLTVEIAELEKYFKITS